MNDNTINAEVTMRDDVPAGGAKRFCPGDEILGRYVVESELGQGGMGVVYLCLDKVGGVKVAVKDLPSEVSHNADEMESVRENFQLVSELQHPNIAGVRTLEKDEKTGDYYLVMAYARGVSLKHWLRQHGGKEHRGEQLKVLRQIASALDYAHNAEPRHIIHRDIKPENVMVDEHGKVFVLDFGLAAQVRSSLSRVSQVVTSRSGTPAYKSPEQWLAQAQRAPSDQYSLGVIAYQMFAGELPFDSDDLDILKHAVTFDSVPKISGESKAANAVFAKVLAKKPQDRFPSCAAFVDALAGRGVDAGSSVRGMYLAVIGALLVLAAFFVIGECLWQDVARSGRLAAERIRLAEIAKQKAERQEDAAARLAAEKAGPAPLTKDEAASLLASFVGEKEASEMRRASEAEDAARRAKAETERMAAEKIAAERKAEEACAAAAEAERKRQLAEVARQKDAERQLREAARRKEQEEAERKAQEDAKLQELRAEVERLRSSAKSNQEEPARNAVQAEEQCYVPTSDRTRRKFDGTPTMALLRFSSKRARNYYERAAESAREGAHNRAKVKADYEKGRACGGPEWPELEAWLDWWK